MVRGTILTLDDCGADITLDGLRMQKKINKDRQTLLLLDKAASDTSRTEYIQEDIHNLSSDDDDSDIVTADLAKYGKICIADDSSDDDESNKELGNTSMANTHVKFKYITEDYVVQSEDIYILVKANSPITIELPECSMEENSEELRNGYESICRRIKIKNNSPSSKIHIQAPPKCNINGINPFSLKPNKKVELLNAGSTWLIY